VAAEHVDVDRRSAFTRSMHRRVDSSLVAMYWVSQCWIGLRSVS
jgi:hypothetical protein